MFVNLNKINNFQFEETVVEHLFGEATAKEYDRLDLNVQDSLIKLLDKSIFQMIDYNSKASFY